MALSRRNAFIVYIVILIVTIGVIVATGFIAQIAFNILLSVYFFFSIIYYLLYIPNCGKPPSHSKPSNTTTNTTNNNEKQSQLSVQMMNRTSKPIASKSSRLYFLDNLKTFLTAMVVAHHIMGSWYVVGSYYNSFLLFHTIFQCINQSYFMPLFFLISGYFTPTSCDRKGNQQFIADKYKRLGIPFLIYTLLIGPALDLFNNKILIKHNNYSYFPDEGPCWFLAWLLIFNICYIIIHKTVPIYVMKFPSLLKLFIFGILLGIIQVIMFLLTGGQFIFMPITIGSLPFNIVFFMAGVIGKRNEWLSLNSPMLTDNIIIIRVITIICVLILSGFWIYLYIINIGYGLLPDKNESESDCSDVSYNYNITMVGAMIGLYVFAGICCFVFSLVLLQFSAIYLNFSNRFTKFLSECAYCVYLIHPWIICPVLWTWVQLVEILFDGRKIIFCHNSTVSKTHFGNNYLLWIGYIYCVIVSFIIVWPIAWCIRQIPGLNKII
eukprot:163524_1